MKFFIVNDMDKPHPPLVAYETCDGTLNYLDRTKKSYDGMGMDRATPIEDFGFVWSIGQTEVLFRQESTGTAKYRDGTPRYWQGDISFSRPIPEDAA